MIADVPRLADLIASPEAIQGLGLEQISGVLVALSALQNVLAARLLVAAGINGNGVGKSSESDSMLSLDEAAAALHQTVDWIKRHKNLPFVRHPDRNTWTISKRDLDKWMNRRRS